ncbi:YciI family protein [Amycolatopsis nigrescens]|uniref:YciI family protein n=1 Tax=Amycolatopsis nigrescens TaxID=381445 RepID=UPI00035E3405|nr:YciI family protein [Amycolatopsis nigrescens]
MKYLLVIRLNPAVWEALPEAVRNEVRGGHGEFIRTIQESGEMISTHALADPSNSACVRARDGVPEVTDGPPPDPGQHMGGYYLVDCESRERAIELARQLPDAHVDGLAVEVRPVMFSAGTDI